MDTVGPLFTFNIIYSCLVLFVPDVYLFFLLHMYLYSPFLHTVKLTPSIVVFTILFIHLLTAVARVLPLLPFPSFTSYKFPIKASHLPWHCLFFLLNKRFQRIPFYVVLHLVRSADTAARVLWTWTRSSLPHALACRWPLIPEPPKVTHYCITFILDRPHQMCLLTLCAPSIYPLAPGMVAKSLSSYFRLFQPFFLSSTAPNHLFCSLSASCFSTIDFTSTKLPRYSFSFNIVWQFQSSPLQFQLYRDGKYHFRFFAHRFPNALNDSWFLHPSILYPLYLCILVSPSTSQCMACISLKRMPLLGKICNSTAITSPEQISALFFLSHLTCFYVVFFSQNNLSF